ERDVVRHETAGRSRSRGAPLDHGMPRVDDGHLVAVVEMRLDVVVDGRGFGEYRKDVERGQRARRRLDAWSLGRHRQSKPLEDLELALEDPLVRAEDLLLVFL